MEIGDKELSKMCYKIKQSLERSKESSYFLAISAAKLNREASAMRDKNTGVSGGALQRLAVAHDMVGTGSHEGIEYTSRITVNGTGTPASENGKP